MPKLCITLPYTDPAGSPQPLSAVVLLNSPALSAADYEDYLRLHRACRGRGGVCYFFCADGAYRGLLAHCGGAAAPCDAVLGDMDSYFGEGEEEAARLPQVERVGPLATVDAVPEDLLERLRARAQGPAPPEPQPPLFIHVTCQMTTDFDKCTLLLQRLRARHPEDFPALQGGAGPAALAEWAADAAAEELSAGETAAAAHEDPQEGARQAALMAETREALAAAGGADLPPTVAVLGALGGRFDHECGVVNTLCRHAGELHLLVADAHNLLFACSPGGLSLWYGGRGGHCGVLPFGPVREMETVGLRWDIVYGRPTRYDGVTQTSGYFFGFGGLISACNIPDGPAVVVDLRVLAPDTDAVNPPAVISYAPHS